MVGASEGARVAPFRLADGGATMAAAVEQQPHLALVVAHHDNRLAADAFQPEVAGLRNFTRMAYVDPSPMENLVEFVLENLRIVIKAGMHAIAFDQRAVIYPSPDHHSETLLR